MLPTADFIDLLQRLIATPSLSREEKATATILEDFLRQREVEPRRLRNNVWAVSRNWREGRPTVLLNSHHDTVKPAAGYTRDPHDPAIADGKLYGLGSNDAGGALVGLIAAFLRWENDPALPVNLVLAATAEEEISGPDGIAALLPQLPPIDSGIVGEPTRLDLAVAERGLVVIDGETSGQSGHAARREGVNALYRAIEDIAAIRDYSFTRPSERLGPTTATVTVISAGTQHNVVPDRCNFVIDLRVNEAYSNQEAVAELQSVCQHAQLKPRSLRLQSSRIPADHFLLAAARRARPAAKDYGSPTLSDQALMPFPTLKIGPGDSARSHTANEFIYVDEVEEGIRVYGELIGHCGVGTANK
ncbi:acetylornithine deacetylase [Lewinella marina]|uniref:Acetylornithine deacetylase n=1 Tax=Neolewinella marina TaxID=438751 RepID=A0A2G0CDP6_9BACT|nr:M20 family metallo-hydrolase [Neolewinella marina]NJB85925.1 acetylornithine deacetylase [Neolewinella marina]PHK98099.1 acetylornithine deacetylase [Neolewinella marina]